MTLYVIDTVNYFRKTVMIIATGSIHITDLIGKYHKAPPHLMIGRFDVIHKSRWLSVNEIVALIVLNYSNWARGNEDD